MWTAQQDRNRFLGRQVETDDRALGDVIRSQEQTVGAWIRDRPRDSRKVIFALCHAAAECVGSKTRQATGPALGNHGVLKTLAIASVLPTVRDLHMFNPIDNRGRRR